MIALFNFDGLECEVLQTADVIDTHVDRSHDVPFAVALAASLMQDEAPSEPYPVPTIKIKAELDAGPLPVDP